MYRLISQSLSHPLALRFGHLNIVFVPSVVRVGFPYIRKNKFPVNQPMQIVAIAFGFF